jgi:hypothetical protein
LPRAFIREHHDTSSTWQKVRLKNLAHEIAPYRDGAGFELIARALGIPKPRKSKGNAVDDGAICPE